MKEDGADAAGGIDAAWFRRIVVKGVVFWVTFFFCDNSTLGLLNSVHQLS